MRKLHTGCNRNWMTKKLLRGGGRKSLVCRRHGGYKKNSSLKVGRGVRRNKHRRMPIARWCGNCMTTTNKRIIQQERGMESKGSWRKWTSDWSMRRSSDGVSKSKKSG